MFFCIIPLLVVLIGCATAKSGGDVTNPPATDGEMAARFDGPVVTTLAGGGEEGYADGTGAAAQFGRPDGLAVDSAGNVYVADYTNRCIRKITPEGVVTTFAGGTRGYVDGTGAAAKFAGPDGVAVDSAGNVYVTDNDNARIRKITPEGVVTTFAGSGETGRHKGGYSDGTAQDAQFSEPWDVAVDTAGNLYVADRGNRRIRKITISTP
jgi:secreted PhoX family phosphatase